MTMLRLPMILAGLLAALVLIAAGCGDDEESTPLTKEEFIAQADAICVAGDEEINAAAEEQFGDLTKEPPVEEQEAFLADVVASSYAERTEEISALTPPEEDAEEVDALVASLEELTEQIENDPAAVLEATEEPEYARLAQEYGLQNCGG